MTHQDQVLRFSFDELDVRGELVYLDASWRDVLDRYDYPEAVRQHLGNALAAASLLSMSVKFKGTMILQIQGNGPLRSLVAQVTSEGGLRGLARWEGHVPVAPLQQVYGKGQMIITILPDDGERYQSIVALSGDTLAEALTAYFEQSEQLPSSFRICVSDQRVAGFFLQALPMSRGHAFSEEQREEDWTRLNLLADTMREAELLELPPATLLLRLYHEETVNLHEPRPLRFACTCSQDKVERTLLTLGRDELESIIADEGSINVDCEFCNQNYQFETADVERLYREQDTVTPGTILH